jgi:hypothetical protein
MTEIVFLDIAAVPVADDSAHDKEQFLLKKCTLICFSKKATGTRLWDICA